jgi:hypothetical protein
MILMFISTILIFSPYYFNIPPSLSGTLLSGWQMARALLVSEDKLSEDPDFYSAKIGTAYFYAEHLLSQVPGMASAVISGGRAVNQLRAEQF